MLRYRPDALSKGAEDSLRNLAAQVAAKLTRDEQIAEAGRLFKKKTPKAAFDDIRSKLGSVSPPGRACFYCERDRYRDIDHVKPKRHYPQFCFSWDNYVFACAICNQDAKGDKYAVFGNGLDVIEFDRSWDRNVAPPVGQAVPIDIRSEDPLDYIKLDLETGVFLPIEVGTRSAIRAEYTIKLFKLFADDLARIRRQAYDSYAHYLELFSSALQDGDVNKARRILQEISELPHPTVLAEMRRQAEEVQSLAELFAAVPPQIGARN
ncbi:hypothetical protein KB221_03130 [Aquidulcibacter paucihalophilus]|nr:hypothetical protein KB221_03130 [Aquidulcibacter paucihalophilus]